MTTQEIVGVDAASRWDSRGLPTIEVVVRTARSSGRALAPAGASTGSLEAVDLRDGGPQLGGRGVQRAVCAVREVIEPALVGMQVDDQIGVDTVLRSLDGTLNFSSVGGNAAVATSMATANAAASCAGVPLWQHLNPDAVTMPVPEIQIFGGGAHAAGRVDLQDFLVVPNGASSFREALEWTAEVYLAAGRHMSLIGRRSGVADEGGWWPEFDSNEAVLDALTQSIADAGLRAPEEMGIALDIAATQFYSNGVYRLRADGIELDRDKWVERLVNWADAFPIVSIEDPFAEDDIAGFERIVEELGHRIQIVGDDLFVTDANRVTMLANRAANAALIKPNQVGTLTEARSAADAAHAAGMGAIISARSGETEDVTITHLAVGWGVPQIKVGSIVRGERTAKWNELLRIEEALGSSARYGSMWHWPT